MSAATLAVEVLVWIAVATCLICCLGIAVMRNAFERLHYMAPVSTIAALSLLVAVVVVHGWGQATIKMSLIFILLFLMNPVLAHVTTRAARVRGTGRWEPEEKEKIARMD